MWERSKRLFVRGGKGYLKKKSEEKRNSIGEIQLAYVYAQCSCASVP